MNVLLVSPVAGRDIAGGDVSYTEALLAHPPDGVTYTTYPEALAAGTLVERGRTPGSTPGRWTATDAGILAARAVEHGLRRTGRLFREPYWYLTVDPDAFDLVHAHVFSVRLVDTHQPLVTGSGFPLPVLYEDRFHWPRPKVDRAARADRRLSRTAGAELWWAPPRRAARTIVQSEHYKQWLVDAGADPARVAVLPLGLDGAALEPRGGPPTTVGFVSYNFEGKGGPVVLRAFRELVAEHPEAKLLIVGSEPQPLDPALPPGSVEWHGRVSRAELFHDLLPRIDVMTLPTTCDSGPPYAVLEALQRGVPVVASDLPWLGEVLVPPAGPRVPADTAGVAGALSQLFDPDHYRAASAAAVELFRSQFSMDVLSDRIGETYRAAVAAPR